MFANIVLGGKKERRWHVRVNCVTHAVFLFVTILCFSFLFFFLLLWSGAGLVQNSLEPRFQLRTLGTNIIMPSLLKVGTSIENRKSYIYHKHPRISEDGEARRIAHASDEVDVRRSDWEFVGTHFPNAARARLGVWAAVYARAPDYSCPRARN